MELHLPDLRFEASATCKSAFGRDVEGPFTYQDLERAVHPDDRARRDWKRHAHVEQGHDYNIEFRNIWPDGSLHWVDVRGRPVYRPDGSIKSLVGVCSDITARKTAEIERETLVRATGGRAHGAGGTDRNPRAARRSSVRPI